MSTHVTPLLDPHSLVVLKRSGKPFVDSAGRDGGLIPSSTLRHCTQWVTSGSTRPLSCRTKTPPSTNS